MLKKMALALTLFIPAAGHTAIYQCEVNGEAVFSDYPCGDDATEVTVDPVTVGGRLDTGAGPTLRRARSRPSHQPKTEEDCPFVNSTDMRRYTIQKKVVRGMEPGDVRHSWGSPSVINTGSTIQWVYRDDSGSTRYVYFRNGCVDSWNGRYPQN